MSLPQPLDFAATWQTYTSHNMRERLSDEGERAFWDQNAVGYDAGNSTHPETYHETLNVIRSLVRPTDTLLDVGTGSGRYALPLSACVQSITALDLSPHMLAILQDKCQRDGISNIIPVEANWEETSVAPHDVVLAAWSLYRQQKMLTSLQKLVDATKRTLIIVDGDYAARPDDDPPHERLRADIWGAGDPGICNYLYFVGMLRQIRVRADVRVVYETATYTSDSVLSLAQTFAPHDATQAALKDYARHLTPYVTPLAEGIRYTCRFAVGLAIWQRPDIR